MPQWSFRFPSLKPESSRIKAPGLCRLYGPPGLAGHISSFIGGVRWDRIGKAGPVFEIHELQGERVLLSRIQVGRQLQDLAALAHRRYPGGRAGLPGEGRCTGTWHPGTRLCFRGGPGRRRPQGATFRFVYATDLADTAANRVRLCALARGADVLICEVGFTDADAEQAKRTGHLTAGACAEIAVEAQVKRLVPFHFSRRYESDTRVIYAEVKAAIGSAHIEVHPGGFGT